MSKEKTNSGNHAETESDSDDNLPEEEHLDRNSLRESTQDNGERRKLRSIYRKLINDLRATGLDDDDDDIDKDDGTINADESRAAAKLKEQLETVDCLYPKVKHTREAALDSHVYSLIASNAKQRVQSLQSDLMQFIPEEFAEKMKSFLDVDRVEYPTGLPNQVWVDLGRSCAPVFKRTPTYHFFSGCFEAEAVLPKVIQRKQRASKDENSGAPTIIQQIAHSEKNYEEQTTEEVENVLQTLQSLYAKNQKEPLCYFQFVIDPTSFSRTVENLFHTSFLVKDGVAKVFYDSFGLPVILPLEKKTNVDSDMFALSMGISVSEWEALKTAFEIKQPAISRKSKRRTQSTL